MGLSSPITQYFISGDVSFLGLLPLQIFTGVDVLAKAGQFSNHVKYLDICGIPYEEPEEEGWGDFEEIFRSFPNLEGIVLNTHTIDEFLNCRLGHIDMEFQQIWRDRVLFIRDILKVKIMTRNEVYKNVQLELRLAKENGCKKECAIRLY